MQKEYLYSVVHTNYIRQKEAVIEYLRVSQLHLSGDGPCDKPGYSAKYGTYTLMDTATDLILDYSLVRYQKLVSSGSVAFMLLCKVALQDTLLWRMKKLTSFHHTGSLEVFHSLLLKYCPKRQHFSYV